MEVAHIVDVTTAKLAAQCVPGVRAVAIQQARGRKYMVISAAFNGHRATREVPVDCRGTVQTAQVRHALNVLVGRDAARAYRQ